EARLYEIEPTKEDFVAIPKPALVVLYADLRVALNGVVSMSERIADLAERYKGFRAEERWGESLEDYVQTLTTINVKSITEKSVTPLYDELLTYTI
ncbi:MAG: hypothetical protein UX64_C0017G0015, partial [Microgenomates group bacterium GW2011_GWC2_46_7]